MEKDIEFEATITAIKKLPKPKGGKNAVVPKKGELYAIELNETQFRFEDGGQLEDVGTIEGLTVFRILENEKSKVTEHQVFVDGVWEVGKKVKCCVNGVVRFDYTQNHSAQHLVTAIADVHFGFQTGSWHMSASGPSSIDLTKNALDNIAASSSVPPTSSPSPPLSSSADISESDLNKVLDQLEKVVNDKVIENAPIHIHTLTYDEYKHPENLPYELRSSGIPEGVTVVRIVEIKGIDANTCCGTHVQSLGQLQMIKFMKVEIAKPGTFRLHYLCGGRLSAAFSAMALREKALTRVLSVAPPDIEKTTVGWIESEGSERKQRKKLEEELAQVLAEEIVGRIQNKGAAGDGKTAGEGQGEGEKAEGAAAAVNRPFHYHRNELSASLFANLSYAILALLPTARVIVTYTQPGTPPLIYSSATPASVSGSGSGSGSGSAAPPPGADDAAASASVSASTSSSPDATSPASASASASAIPPPPPFSNVPLTTIAGKNAVTGNFSFIASPTAEGIAWVKDAGPKFSALLKGKGGGKDNKYSGKIEDLRELRNIGSLLG